MGVDSYLEIVTTILGWQFSSVLVDLLFGTGLALLPLLFGLIGLMIEGFESGFDEPGVAAALIRSFQIKVYSSLFVMFMCVAINPLMPLSKLSLSHTPAATVLEPAPETVTGEDMAKSSFNKAFSDAPGVVYVPTWWDLTMRVSSGFSVAARASLGSGLKDYRMMQDLALTATIENPLLRRDIQRFYSECFVPARSRFLRQDAPSASAQALMTTYGPSDVDWVGSHVYREEPDLYATLYAKNIVKGFVFNPTRDTDLNEGEEPPFWGWPSCKEWWEEETVGLRTRMVTEMGGGSHMLNGMTTLLGSVTTQEQRWDALARLALKKATPFYVNHQESLGYDGGGVVSGLAHAPAQAAGLAGSAWEAFKASASGGPMIRLMIMAQAFVLMGVYMLIVPATIFSGYDLKMMVYGSLTIFTVKFWTVLWFFCRWIDEHLIEMMNPSTFDLIDDVWNAAEGSSQRMLLNIAMLLLFAGLPLIWSALMTMAGYRIADGVSDLMKQVSGSAGHIGSNAKNTAGSGISNSINRRRDK
jgi:hypothetical protein